MLKWIAILVVVVVALPAGAWYLLTRSSEAAVSYRYASVTRGDVTQTVSGSGTVRPTSTMTQRVGRRGSVTSLSSAAGDQVKAGDELFRIDNRPVFALEGTTPFYRVLTSSDDEGPDVVELQKMLMSLGYYDGKVDGVYSGATQTAVEDFQDDRELERDSEVGPETFQTVSPQAVVLSLSLAVSDAAVAGQTAMVTMSRGSLEAVVDVNEVDFPQVREGQQVTLTMDALPGETFTGTVTDRSPGLLPPATTRTTVAAQGAGGGSSVVTFPVTVAIDDPSAQVTSGMSVDADFVVRTARDVLTVPASAIQVDGDVYYVEVPRSGSETLVDRVDVKVGVRSEQTAEIVAGLNEGQTVVEGIDLETLQPASGGLLTRPDTLRGKRGLGQ